MVFFDTLFYGALVMIMLACGSRETEIRYEGKPKAYSWNDMKAKCFTCHNSAAPQIPTTEAEFKASAKVKAEIQSGDMPKGDKSNFDKAAALSYLEN